MMMAYRYEFTVRRKSMVVVTMNRKIKEYDL